MNQAIVRTFCLEQLVLVEFLQSTNQVTQSLSIQIFTEEHRSEMPILPSATTAESMIVISNYNLSNIISFTPSHELRFLYTNTSLLSHLGAIDNFLSFSISYM